MPTLLRLAACNQIYTPTWPAVWPSTCLSTRLHRHDIPAACSSTRLRYALSPTRIQLVRQPARPPVRPPTQSIASLVSRPPLTNLSEDHSTCQPVRQPGCQPFLRIRRLFVRPSASLLVHQFAPVCLTIRLCACLLVPPLARGSCLSVHQPLPLSTGPPSPFA